ncbi:hypothetical protein [Streptomyces sp. S.PB5]|nr:hypothetical protein [Streptomyces sp. S.PB5]MDN3022727.1 hypothetical protein [Streptomyces sp. S.PB5]
MASLALAASLLTAAIVTAIRLARRPPCTPPDGDRIRNVIRSPHHCPRIR